MIKINCTYVGGAVAVPTDLLDKHLKLAPSASFKVLLFILRNPDGAADEKQISLCTGLSENDVKDCLEYWEANGVIACDDRIDGDAAKKAVSNLKAVKKEPLASSGAKTLPVKKPTQREMAMRLSEQPELSEIYKEAQKILGVFGYDTQALILMIYDYFGFPPEVIITLLNYQKSLGKTSSAAIKARAEDWSKRGIDTLELVDEELRALEKRDTAFSEFCALAPLEKTTMTPSVARYIREWAVDRGFDAQMIALAFAESGKSFGETNKLLRKWSNSGIKTPEDVEKRRKKSIPAEHKKSYDTENIGRNSVLDWVRKVQEEEEQK